MGDELARAVGAGFNGAERIAEGTRPLQVMDKCKLTDKV